MVQGPGSVLELDRRDGKPAIGSKLPEREDGKGRRDLRGRQRFPGDLETPLATFFAVPVWQPTQ
jgi:hypothetical protein